MCHVGGVLTITYESICKKLGFDPIVDEDEYLMNLPDYEDDSRVSPGSILSQEELQVLIEHLIQNRDKLERYVIRRDKT